MEQKSDVGTTYLIVYVVVSYNFVQVIVSSIYLIKTVLLFISSTGNI